MRTRMWWCGRGGEVTLPLSRYGDAAEAAANARLLWGAGANPSRLRPGLVFGLGFRAFLTSFCFVFASHGSSVTQKGGRGKSKDDTDC